VTPTEIHGVAVAKKSALPDFESALSELEKIVEKMESGEQSLVEALASFQRGIELTRTCQQGLKEAEQRVEKLITEQGDVRIAPFHEDDED
jgi:exodeoxyribonuclease VII small subunit